MSKVVLEDGAYSYHLSSQHKAQRAGVTLYVQLELDGPEVRKGDETWQALFSRIEDVLDLQAVLTHTPAGSADGNTICRGLTVQNAEKTLTAACLLAISGLAEDAAEQIVEAIARQFLPVTFTAFVEAGYFVLTTSYQNSDVKDIYNPRTQQFDW